MPPTIVSMKDSYALMLIEDINEKFETLMEVIAQLGKLQGNLEGLQLAVSEIQQSLKRSSDTLEK